MRALRLGSRRSPMAIAQSAQVAAMITERTGRSVEIVKVTTRGDLSRARLAQIGGTGVFVSAARRPARRRAGTWRCTRPRTCRPKPRPTSRSPRCRPGTTPGTLVVRDGARLAGLTPGARIGTGSPRRAAQLLALRADLRCVPVRGNAGTRLAKISAGELDAVVLAHAGLARIGYATAITQLFEPGEMIPAPGQGVRAETRAGLVTFGERKRPLRRSPERTT